MPRTETAELMGRVGLCIPFCLHGRTGEELRCMYYVICFDWFVLVFAYEERAAQGLTVIWDSHNHHRRRQQQRTSQHKQ